MSSVSSPSNRMISRVVAALVFGALVLTLPGLATPPADAETPALTVPFALVADRDVNDRLAQPEDRHALAGGCYTMKADDGAWVGRDGTAIVEVDQASATPFHFQPTRLGEYLIAANEGPDTAFEGATWDTRSYLAKTAASTAAQPGLPTVTVSVSAALVDRPSVETEWVIEAADGKPDRRSLDGQEYLVRRADGTVDLGRYTFHHVADDNTSDADANGTACANWPEVDTNTVGRPSSNPAGPAAPVQGFFESHVHGMAFEFLGGEARCGQPWHPYGVEYALVDCDDHAAGGRGAALEVAVSGGDPINGHDTVGWPTFGYWPRHDSLTHEQYYWRWLERAYLGGLRLSVNLFVDNTALCEIYPVKRNSCNEMDGVRLQAQRLFELQDYIDAQNGGPGEGWLRIVTNPAQARQVINAGRLAVVMGIEVSELFDCSEFLDVPNCTTGDIDERLQEVYDMGIRQMELVNKFDNALSGVTGDGGTTGIVVNVGQRYTSGHFWDMQSCAPTEEGHSHEHDKTQTNFSDDFPDGGQEEIDILAGAILGTFGPTRGAVAPAYPAGPHCNTRGLTDLGRHLITQMAARGMIIDPDHMSAAAQRSALDLIQNEIIPAEHERAHAEGRPPVQPSLISSHSWGNDEIYQRIYALDGVIGARTASADSFVDRWAQRRSWADGLAPEDSLFGLGYGADTNGLGGQPGPRSSAAVALDYSDGITAPVGEVTINQHTSGVRTYDIATDGVAHYGLFADWFAELRLAADEEYASIGGGDAIIEDMLNGSEAYLRMWERATYGSNDCVADGSHLQTEDLHAAVGGNLDGFLAAAGVPMDRDGAAYVYCATDPMGHPVQARVTFDRDGQVGDVHLTPAWELDQPLGMQ